MKKMLKSTGLACPHLSRKLTYLLLLLVTLIGGSNSAWAQTTSVAFNNDVRYSQWIMDSRLPDFKGNTNKMGFPIYETDGTVKTDASTWDKKDTGKSAKNDYVAGLVAKAAIENAIYYGAFDWSKSYFRAVKWYTENIADIPTSGGSLDNLNPAKMHFGLYTAANSLNFSSIAGSVASNAQTQLNRALAGLAYYNTNYAFGTTNYPITSVDGKDVTGGWFHKHDATPANSYDNEMWCDGQYMGPALLAQLIANKSTLNLSNNDVLNWDIVAKQFTITWNQLWNETDALLYHAFTGDRTTSISHGWILDDGVYHSKAYWGRAVGWYMLGLVDVLEQMPSGNANYATLKGYLNKLAAGVARYQTANGVWYQVMDEKNSALTGNYEEASCSAIFAAAYLKGTRLNLFTDNYQTVATNAYQGCISQFMKFDNSDKAKVHLVNSCASAGLGGSNQRSGERSYYINGYAGGGGKDVTKIIDYTEGKPLGAFIMAATEYEQLYQDGQNLKFTSDLAPSYTCNGTTDALKAEAMGGNTVPTYQWYKNSQAIPSATSSSYIPTESGNYYCVATGGNTIQTSTAAVTVAAAPAPSADMWTVESCEYNSTSKGYEVQNVGTYYKSTSGGTSSSIPTNDDNATWSAGKKCTGAISSIYFCPAKNITGLKLYIVGTSNRSWTSASTATTLDGTYNTLTQNTDYTVTSNSSNSNFVPNGEYTTVTLNYTNPIEAGKYLCYTFSGNVKLYGVELITAPTTPEITIATHPQGGSSVEFAAATAMTVVASASNGSTCTYQWQSASSENGGYSDIDGATSASYTVGNTGVSDKWYHCVVSAEGCDPKTSNNVRYQVTGGSSTVSNLTKIEANYTYTPDAALPASTMTSDSKILAYDAGNSYVQNFGLSFKTGRQIAFKVAAGATVTAELYNNGGDARTAVLSTSAGHSNDVVASQTVPNTDSRTATLTFTPTTDATYYLCGASDLYLKELNITFPAPQSSEKTPTAVSGGTIVGTVITATEVASANAGQSQTVTLTLPAGASASMQDANGTGATITSAGVLTYNALAAGTNSSITIRITAEDGTTQDYTVNVSTAAAAPTPAPGGDVTVYSWNGNGSTTTANEKGGTASKIGSSSNITVGKSQGGNYTWTIATTSTASGDAVNVAFNEALEASDVITIGYFQKDEGSTYLNVNFYNSSDEEIGTYSSTNADYIASNGTPSDQTLSLTTGTYEGATYARIFRTKDGSNSAKTIYISKFVITRQGTPEPGFTVTFDGNGQTLATTALTQPTTGQAILLPAGYDSSEDVAVGTWKKADDTNAIETSMDFAPTTGYYEVYNEGSVAAGNVLIQTISGLDNDATYEIVLSVGASYTSGRGFECSTGNNLTEAFAGSKSVNIPVFDRTQVTNENKNTVTFVLQPTDGSITFGLRNIAASGNWFIAKVESIKKVNTANFNGWYTAATDGTKVGDAGDPYTPTNDITIYAQWKGVTTHLVKFNPAGGTATVMAGSVDITAEATNGTGAQVEEGTEVVISVTAPGGKGFKNWKNNTTGATTSNTYFDGTSYKYTVASLTEDVDLNVKFENKVEFDAPSDPAILFQTNVTSSDVLTLAKSSSSTTTDLRNYATVVGAAATLHNGNSTSDAQMTYARLINLAGSSASYLMIDLGEDKAFAAGDLITFGNNEQMKLSNTASTGSIKSTGGVYTVQESDGIAGSRYLYIFKDGDQDAGGSAAFSSLLITRGALKKDITRLSPKGGTAKNTMYVSETNTPIIYVGTFEAGDDELQTSDFEITCEPAGVVTAEIRNATINNTIDANGYRTFTLNVNTVGVGSARVNINFKGNDQYKAKSDFIPYTIIAKRTVTFNGGDGATNVPAAAYCGDGLTTKAPEVGSMTKAGYEFVGWNTAADGSGTAYAPGDDITVTADLTLYAQWKQVGEQALYHYTVTASQSAVTDDEAIGGTFSSTKAAQPDGSIKVDFNSQSSKNIKFSLNKAIAAGDVIKITMHQGSSSSAGENVYGFGVSSTVNQTPEALLWIPTGSGQNAQVISYKVPEESPLIGKNTLYLHRLNGTSLYFHEIEITRVAQAGTDATIKSVVINGHIIPETVDSEGNPTYIYNIGELYWGSNNTIPVTITPNDAAARVNSESAGATTINVEKDVVNNVVITAANGSTTATYKVQVNKAQTLGETTDAKYAVSNTTYYEGQKMNANGVSAWISLSAGTDAQLSFPTTVLSNGDYGYRIVNTMGENPTYDNTTGVPSAGTYYKFTPTQAGMLTVAVQLNANKQLIISNGAKIFVPGVDYQYDLKSMDDGSAVSLDNSGKASVNAVGTVTFSVSSKDYYVYAATSKLSLMGFELNTTVPKYTVTASATAGGSVSINSGAIASGSEVAAGTPLTIVAIPATDYKFTGWTNADGEVISTQSTYTVDALNADVNITAQFAATGIVTGHATFPLDVMKQFGAADPSMTSTFYDTGNPTTAHLTLSTSSNKVQAQNGSDGTKVQKEGEFIITPASGCKIKSIVIHTGSRSSGRVLTSDPADEPTVDGLNQTYVFDNLEEAVRFFNPADASGNVYVTAIDVVYEYQAGTEKEQYLGSFPANSSINDYVGAEYAMPKLTVTNDGAVITVGFTVTYSSNDESVATVEEGTNKITLVGAGSTSIVATITPTSGNANILGSTATITVTSKALEALEVTMNDVKIATTDADYEIPAPVVKVGNATLAANEYTISYVEKTDASNIVTVNGSQITLNGTSAKWTVGQATLSVTVTPTAAAKDKYHCVASATDEFMITVEGNKLQPYIDMIPEIDMSVSSSIDLVSNVIYGGEPINEYFNFSYALTGSAASKNSSTTNTVKITSGASAGDVTLTITATPKTDYENVYLSAEYSVTIHVKDLNKFTSVTVSPTSISMNVGETKPSPTITVVDNEGNTLDEDEYSVLWSSNATSFATVNPSTGVSTGIADGTATLTVVVSKDGYESVSKTVSVTVTDPSAFKVVDDTPYAHGTLLSNSEATMAVALGGWIFSGKPSVSDYGCGNNDLTKTAWGSATGVGTDARTKVTGYDKYLKYGNDNARNENGNNAQPESNALYTGTLSSVTTGYTTIDQMFNVPCAGSYLEFNPKTNGTVTAVISQNGVFDYASSTAVYRPQRRVFVLDEMGNLVQSTPKLLNGAGKFEKDAKDFTTYTWDVVKTGGSNTHCSADMVREHFGIEDFKSDDEHFQNGVYECLVDNELMHNAAVANGADFPGAKGWSVLVPAPVSYTFDVKAGKTYYLYNFGSKIGFYGFNFNEAKDVVVDEVTLSQENAQPVLTQIGHVAKVNISDRPVKNNIWNAMVLPFSLNKQQVDAIFGHTYDKEHQDGTQIVYFEEVDLEKQVIHFTRHAYNTIVAGKPFLIKPNRTNLAADATFTVNTADAVNFPYVTVENTQPAAWGRDKNKGTDDVASFKWISDYKPMQVKYGSYYLSTTDGTVKHYVPASGKNKTATMKGFRGFLEPQSESSMMAKVMTLAIGAFDDENDTTTAFELVFVDENGSIRPVSDGKIYNMSGILVGNKATDLNSLPAGIYIMNGEKFFIK